MARKRRNRVSRINKLHLWTLISRYSRQTFGSLKSVLMIVLQMPLMLLLVALVYEKDTFVNQEKAVHAMTIIFILVLISCFMALLNSYREITKEREILTREIAGGLDSVSYVTSKFLVLSGIVFVQTLILTLGSLIFIDFNFSRPFFGFMGYFFSIFLVGVCCTAIGLLVSAVIKRSESAVLPVLLILVALMLFAGTLFDFAPPAEYVLYISPSYWALSLFGNSLGLMAKPMFDQSPLLCAMLLVVMIIIFYILTVFVVMRTYKTKQNRN